MRKLSKLFYFVFVFLLVSLFLFTFTQVDLGLTLSKDSGLAEIQQNFQHVGYFNRPLSTLLFSIIMIGLFACYLYLLNLAKKLSRKTIWILIFTATIILAFSYNGFSYDIFNYIFDAKIVTHYGSNPYSHKALDYPTDPMLSFMHWTHRVYPYGPAWLLLTVPLSFLGGQIFTVTFVLFKILMAGSFIGTVYFIEKIMKKISPAFTNLSLVFFALNPFILTESLVSAHNDIVMMFFGMIGIYLAVTNKFFRSILILSFSAAIKYITGLLLPLVFLIWMGFRKKVKIEWDKILQVFIVALSFGVIAASLRTNFQPWYLLFIFPVLALLVDKKYYLYPATILSFGSLLIYAPYIYMGNDSYSISYLLPLIEISTLAIAVLVGISLYFNSRKSS